MNSLRWRPLATATAAAAAASAPPATTPMATCGAVRFASQNRAKRHDRAGFGPTHGEQIWVFNNILTNQIIYSHKHVLRNNRALKQLPFNGKKTKPAKLRKDHWRPMALVQFAEGDGVIGRSAFQRLREFRRLHELSWGYQKEEFEKLNRKELGEALNDQRANAVADLAAVLAGQGAGSRVVITEKAPKAKKETTEVTGEGTDKQTAEPAPTQRLAEATVFWANEHDRNLAQSWSSNVTHAAGLPGLTAADPLSVEPPVSEETAKAA